MRAFRADLLQAVRHYLTTPLSSATAVIVLGAAMAALTALLALWSALSIGSHPGFEDSRGLVTVAQTDGDATAGISYGLIEMIDEQSATLGSIAGILGVGIDLELESESEPVTAELVTRRYFPALRPRMQLGRPLGEVDHQAGAEPVVVVSDAFWRGYLGAGDGALGQTVRLRGPNATLSGNNATSNPSDSVRDYRVVGVLAPAMSGTLLPNQPLLLPFEAVAEDWFVEIGGLEGVRNGTLPLIGVARLSPGASTAAVRTELRGRFEEASAALGFGLRDGFRLEAVRGVVRDFEQQRDALAQLRLFLGAAALLALVAACNVSLFLLARAPGRRRELAIRVAVGAPIRRLARQLMTEAGVLVACATVLGLVLSLWTTALAGDLAFLRGAAIGRDVTPFDWRVLAAVALFALLVTVLVSIAPVIGLKHVRIGTGSRNVIARASLAQRVAGTLQLSVAAVIGAAALAFVWYLRDVAAADPGFSAENVTVAMLFPANQPDFSLGIDVYLSERERRRDVLAAFPGVEDVAFGTSVPGQVRQMFRVPSAPPENPDDTFAVNMQTVDSGYMRMLDVRLLDGRLLEDDDRDRIVINEALAQRLWGRVDVTGEILPTGFGPNGPRWEIAGIIKDIAFGHPADAPEPMAFMIAHQLVLFDWALLRTRLPVAEIRRMLDEKVDSGELEVQIGNIVPIGTLWGSGLAPDRARTGLAVAAALLVVALALLGYYGTQHFLVAAGRREYAILAAVGAGPRALGRLVLLRGLILGAPGLVLGGLLAFITVALLRGEYVSNDVSPAAITAAVCVTSAALLLVSALGPARSARRTDPGPLLKQD